MEPQREQKEMALVRMGLLGSTIVALCCFTPGFRRAARHARTGSCHRISGLCAAPRVRGLCWDDNLRSLSNTATDHKIVLTRAAAK